jgi:hypothetical protein
MLCNSLKKNYAFDSSSVTMEREESERKVNTVADLMPKKSAFVDIMEEIAKPFRG